MVTIAAAGDVHASEATRQRLEQSFAAAFFTLLDELEIVQK